MVNLRFDCFGYNLKGGTGHPQRVMKELGEEEVAMIRRMALSQMLAQQAGGGAGGPGGKGSQNIGNLLQLA